VVVTPAVRSISKAFGYKHKDFLSQPC
jgi:hypothetical protein